MGETFLIFNPLFFFLPRHDHNDYQQCNRINEFLTLSDFFLKEKVRSPSMYYKFFDETFYVQDSEKVRAGVAIFIY